MSCPKDAAVPDGGYGWVVCFAACMVHFIVSGVQNNFGVMYIYILKELGDGGKAKSAWVGSINVGVTLFVSPLVTTACRRLGCRMTGITGGLFCAAGLVTSSLVTSLYWLYVTYGVVAGIGCGLCYITTFRILSLWFGRRIALVNYLAIGGGVIGNTVIAPSLQRMLAVLGLSRAFLFLAAMFILCSVAAIVYKPSKKTEQKQPMPQTKKPIRWFDFSVLKHKSYMSFVLATSLVSVAFPVVYTHAPTYAKEMGASEQKAAMLIVIEAPSVLVTVLLFGKIDDYFSSYRLEFYQAGILIYAVVHTFMAAARPYSVFITLMVLHGIATGIVISLRPVIAEQILGKERASEGVGMLFGILGFAYIIGPPLVGWIYDISKSYPLAFLVSGGLCTMASCILFLVPLFQESKANEEEPSEQKPCKQYPNLPVNYPEKRTCVKMQSQQHETTSTTDWRRVLAVARESNV